MKVLNIFGISDSTHDQWTWQEKDQKNIQREMKTAPDGWEISGTEGKLKISKAFQRAGPPEALDPGQRHTCI